MWNVLDWKQTAKACSFCGDYTMRGSPLGLAGMLLAISCSLTGYDETFGADEIGTSINVGEMGGNAACSAVAQ